MESDKMGVRSVSPLLGTQICYVNRSVGKHLGQPKKWRWMLEEPETGEEGSTRHIVVSKEWDPFVLCRSLLPSFGFLQHEYAMWSEQRVWKKNEEDTIEGVCLGRSKIRPAMNVLCSVNHQGSWRDQVPLHISASPYNRRLRCSEKLMRLVPRVECSNIAVTYSIMFYMCVKL